MEFYLGPEYIPLDQRKQVQMITAKRSPMDVILTYHSSEYNDTEVCENKPSVWIIVPEPKLELELERRVSEMNEQNWKGG